MGNIDAVVPTFHPLNSCSFLFHSSFPQQQHQHHHSHSTTSAPMAMNMIFRFFLNLFLFSSATAPTSTSTSTSSTSIHELLKSRGLPPGLFPKNGVKSYQLSEDGVLQVFLDNPCVAKFETRIFFESVVRANLSYGGLIGVEGLSQEELFLWLPVKDIIVYDPSSGLILFDIGVAHKQMSLSLFEDPPLCYPRFGMLDKNRTKQFAFGVER